MPMIVRRDQAPPVPARISTSAGSFLVPASTGNFSVTGLPFQPGLVLMFGNGQTADGYVNSFTQIAWCLGLGTPSQQLSLPCSSDGDDLYVDAASTSTILNRFTQANVPSYVANLVSLDLNGFTLDFTLINGSIGAIVNYIAIAWSGSSRASIVPFTSRASVGPQIVQGVGFTPDAILFLGTDGGATGHGHLSWGFTQSPSARGCVSIGVTGISGGATEGGIQLQTAFVNLNDQASGVWRQADLTSMDSDGFTLNWTVINSGALTQTIYALCLKGGSYKFGVFTQKVSTGSQSITGVGFQPSGLLMLWHGAVSSLTADQQLAVGLGVSSGASGQGVMYYGDRATRPPTCSVSRSKIYEFHSDNAPPTPEGEADLVTFGPDGFTLNWTVTDGFAREIFYLAMF